jgi:tRNA threonylcarbamoyladenosine biosynthesis protein TsaB
MSGLGVTEAATGPRREAHLEGPAVGRCLAVDTSTRTSVVCIGRDEPEVASLRVVQHRHGSFLLEQVQEVLTAADASLAEIALLAVGTGPGSFTGLRVGLATAKTLAYAGGRPVVGIASSDALRRAALAAGAPADATIVLPAGAHDQYLARPGEAPMLVPPGDLRTALGGRTPVAVDLDPDVLGAEATALGQAAIQGLPAALLALARERLAASGPDDGEALVPVYVALPRGAPRTPEELAWSPDLR